MKGISLSKEDIFKEQSYQVNLHQEEPITCVEEDIENHYETSTESSSSSK